MASKLCECGCGEPAPISKYTDNRTGTKRGQPTRFIQGHSSRVNWVATEARQRWNEDRKVAVRPRRERVLRMYERGVTFAEMAEREGVSKAVVNQDVRMLRGEGRLGYRNVPVAARIDSGQAEQVAADWSKREMSARAIGERYGWSRNEAQSVIAALRAAGFTIDRRYAEPVALNPEERRRIAREYRKRKGALDDRSLTDGQRMVLRLLGVARRPLGSVEIAGYLEAAGEKAPARAIQNRLALMREAGLVERVTPPDARWFERRYRWFVPLGGEVDPANLTLEDATRETELAALIEDQGREAAQTWVTAERGHWNRSLDAPMTEDGFSLLDVEGAEDGRLVALTEDAA